MRACVRVCVCVCLCVFVYTIDWPFPCEDDSVFKLIVLTEFQSMEDRYTVKRLTKDVQFSLKKCHMVTLPFIYIHMSVKWAIVICQTAWCMQLLLMHSLFEVFT